LVEETVMDEIKDEIEKIRIRAEAIIRSSAGGSGNTKRAMDILDSLVRLAVINEGLIKDRDYWQALAMQFHDAVHAEIERRAKVEI
jgi:hypothetical protein